MLKASPLLRQTLCNTWLIFAGAAIALASRNALAVEHPPKKLHLTSSESGYSRPTDFKSEHFLLHTDLPAEDAHELLAKLETMLVLISKYWAHPQAGVVELYVVKDLAVWPSNSLNPAGRAKIAEHRGVTLTDTLSLGRKKVAAKAVVYAIPERGTPQHEAVHAYCGQTFGTIGPSWYGEGMAEMGSYWRAGDSSVNCSPYFIKYLRGSKPKSLKDIVGAKVTIGDRWQDYAWCWALCHMLANNTNYAPRFRPLGLGFLAEQPVSFEQTYGAMAEEISFEYRFFLAHIDRGYRVDLCSWDWKRKFRPVSTTAAVTRVVAARGWQPSGVSVTAGQTVEYSASGAWQINKAGPEVGADGDHRGAGRLEGVLFHDFKLAAPFPLGAFGTFTAEEDGKLYLRCHDNWNELADNKGALTVKLKRSGQGIPLAPAKERTQAIDSAAE